MEKYKRILFRLGFSTYEIEIYLSLLKTGPRGITEIAQDTGFHRPVIYKMLKTLRERGYILLSPTKGKRVHYQITDPQALFREIESFTQDSNRAIEELHSIYSAKENAPTLIIKSGIEEIRSIHQDLVETLPKGGIYYRYSSSHRNYAEKGKYVPERYFELQKSKELERYIITNEAMRALRSDNPMREVVAIPQGFDLFDDNITKLIYANKVAIIDYNTETGWIIESAGFAEYERKIFRLLFGLLKKEGSDT